MLRGVLFCSIVLFSQVRTEGSGPITVLDTEPVVERQRLRLDLLQDYDRTTTAGHPTVHVFYDVRHLLGLDEKSQILSVNGILELTWAEPRLKWDPNSYSGITEVRFDSYKVWVPQIQAAFNVRPVSLSDPPPVLVSSEGVVRWFPQVRFDVPCSADYRHYPFDAHRCALLLFDNRRVILATDGRGAPALAEGSEWVVRDTSHSVQVLQEHPFYRIRVEMDLHRKSRIYRYVCVLPTLLSICTLLCGFWLLPCDPSRYVIGCANVIVLSMLLQHLATILPAANGLPIISQYSASCLCISSLFVVLSALNHLLRRSTTPPPGVLLRLSESRLLCLFSFSHVSAQEEGTLEATPPDERKRRADWLLVSVLVDRLAFWCFSLLFVILLAVLAAV